MKVLKSFLLAAMMGAPAMMSADYALVVELNNGDTHEYTMQDKPIVSFVDNGVAITSNDETTTYSRSDFNRFFFTEVGGDHDAVTEVRAEVNFQFIDRNNVFVKFTPDEDNRVMIYDMSGRTVSVTQAVDGEATVSLDNLAPGVYILYTHNHSIKISKR